MSEAPPPSRLSADGLDEIIAELALTESSVLDRLQLWYKDLLRTLWQWLKQLTGGEDGWLNQLTQWFEERFSSFTDTQPIEAEGFLNVISWLSAAVVLGLLGYLGFRLWQLYHGTQKVDHTFAFAQRHAHLNKPLKSLAPNQQAAALFIQACLQLSKLGLVTLTPKATNTRIASEATLPAPQHNAFCELAAAADRALFGGWVPDDSALAKLVEKRQLITTATDSQA